MINMQPSHFSSHPSALPDCDLVYYSVHQAHEMRSKNKQLCHVNENEGDGNTNQDHGRQVSYLYFSRTGRQGKGSDLFGSLLLFYYHDSRASESVRTRDQQGIAQLT